MNHARHALPVLLSTALGGAGTLLAVPDGDLGDDRAPVDAAPTGIASPVRTAGGDPECPTRPLSIEPNEVSTTADGARSVSAADLDGDDDMDLVVAAQFGDTIAWYESDGQTPPGFTERVISSTVDGPQSVFAIDVDGDGDVDVVFAANFADDIGWYENDGQSPPGFTPNVLDGSADGASSVYAADLDGDLDIDIIGAAGDEDTVRWWENDGNLPPAFTERTITAAADGVVSAFAFDIDNDDDMDVLAAFGSTVEWYENDGAKPPSFTARLVTDTVSFAQAVHAADLDGDGDGDPLSASLIDNTVAWYENDGNDPPAFTKRIISSTAGRPTSVYARDLDGDSSIDVLAASSNDDTLYWYQNDGTMSPTFAPFVINTAVDSVQCVIAADIDGDLQPDAASASFNDDTVAWFRLTEPELGVCCLADGSCEETTCLSDCASLSGWAWEPGITCAEVTCPGDTSPALFLVEQLDIDRFRANIEHLAAYGTRYWDRPQNHEAVLWIKGQLESYGYDNVTLSPYTYQDVEKFNVYATKIGETRPTEMYIVGAHMDTFNINGDFDNAPGADDDGSGTSSVMEMARVFASADTDISVRFVLWNNEETGLNGSRGYVESRRDLQGTMEEPTWLGMIQQDMILYDRFAQRDVDVEYQMTAQNEGRSVILGAFVAGAMGRYGTGEFPSQVSGNMRNTDSVPFMDDTSAISVRENTRDEIGNGSNPNWHQPTDVPETYTDEDYRQGFNTSRMICGAIGELVGARPAACPEDLDDSGAVDFGDILAVLAAWGDAGGPEDIDGSGTVDFGDILAILAVWGPCS